MGVVLLSVVLMKVILLSVVMLGVIMLNDLVQVSPYSMPFCLVFFS
jgi:hypothetical protein